METTKPKWIKHPIRKLLLLYLVYVLAMNIFPFVGNRTVSEEKKQEFAQVSFYGGEENGADRITLLETPADAMGARLALVQNATETLDVVYHSMMNGDTTDAFFAELLAAADRGVQVRILLDGKSGTMHPQVNRAAKALGQHPNITWRKYVPINLLKPWEFQIFLHDKYIIADSKILITGGRNHGDRFFAPAGYDTPITYDRDVMILREKGKPSVIDQMNDYFSSIWNEKNTKDARTNISEKKRNKIYKELSEYSEAFCNNNPQCFERSLEDYINTMVPTKNITLISNPTHTWKKEPWVAYQMYMLAIQAEEQVILQTPFATANSQMLGGLADINTKAPVSLVTNSMGSSNNYPAFSNYFAGRKRFMATGTTLYEYQSIHSIHAKSMVIDGRLSAVGSMNMDDRSLYLDTEIMLVVDSEEFNRMLAAAIADIQSESLVVNSETNNYIPNDAVYEIPVSTAKKIGMRVASWFSRLVQYMI